MNIVVHPSQNISISFESFDEGEKKVPPIIVINIEVCQCVSISFVKRKAAENFILRNVLPTWYSII